MSFDRWILTGVLSLTYFWLLGWSLVANGAEIIQGTEEDSVIVLKIKSDETMSVGDVLTIIEGEKHCVLVAETVKDKIVLASSIKCKDKSLLTIGKIAVSSSSPKKSAPNMQKSQPNLVQQPVPLQIADQRDSVSAVLIGFTLSPIVEIPGTFHSGTNSETGSVIYNFHNSIVLGYEWSQFRPFMWNHGFGLDFRRFNFDTLELKGDVSGSVFGIADGEMSVISAYYSGKYIANGYYIPAGVGITSSSVTSSAAFIKTMSTRLYLHVGFGLLMKRKFAIEANYSAIGLNSETVLSGSDAIVPSNLGYIRSVQLNFKVLF